MASGPPERLGIIDDTDATGVSVTSARGLAFPAAGADDAVDDSARAPAAPAAGGAAGDDVGAPLEELVAALLACIWRPPLAGACPT